MAQPEVVVGDKDVVIAEDEVEGAVEDLMVVEDVVEEGSTEA